MKNPFSLIACFLIGAVLLLYRLEHSDVNHKGPLRVTVWDAFGYYLYVPSTLIYHDYKELKWCDSVDHVYSLSGGTGLPVQQADNGHYVNKYLGGVALMQVPLFFIGHAAAKALHYPADGYSPPYQYALGLGIICYCLLAALVLRRVLLYYFDDRVTAASLILVCLATNFIQYAAVDNGQSHAYIFVLYALVLYTTIRWHRRPSVGWAVLTGYIVGLATISRPTEAIMLFIPLLWHTQDREAARQKWAMVRSHRSHVILAVVAGLLGILPQLLYWKAVSGSWVYDVGSKWVFLNPWFRVLVGWEKGWFIYTPVTLFFIAGFWFMRGREFRKAVLAFCLLNIWIVIAWDDWQYGGSYAARALVQSYPVFALPLASLIDRVRKGWWKYLFYPAAVYLLGVNLFQTVQYNETILHFREMNRRYYGRIYLNPHPTPLDMSLMDTQEFLYSETGYRRTVLVNSTTIRPVRFTENGADTIAILPIPPTAATNCWIRVEAGIEAPNTLWESELHAALQRADTVKDVHIRLYNPIGQRSGRYACYVAVPPVLQNSRLLLYLTSPHHFEGVVHRLTVTRLEK